MQTGNRPLHFTLKIVSRCNLNCSYCYVYHKADQTWRERPAVMSDEIFAAAVERIRAHCQRSGQRPVRILFHGGEPCLVGSERFASWCDRILDRVGAVTRVQFSIQTNGTLLDKGWADLFSRYGFTVGVSMDGPKDIHDKFRIDHAGQGSLHAVLKGIEVLRAADIPLAILCVVPLGVEPLQVHRYFVELGVRSIDYILPDYSHDSIGQIRLRYGSSPCADFLVPVFDDWWHNGTLAIDVGPFRAIARAILGGRSEVDFIGNRPYGFVFVEADGEIEGLDVLRACSEGLSRTGLNVLRDDFVQIAEVSELHRNAIFEGLPIPTDCVSCPENTTCAGGYLPHRYSQARGFDNASVWCNDLLLVFQHIRSKLGVSVEETQLRQLALNQLASEAFGGRLERKF